MRNDFENQKPVGKVLVSGEWVDDYVKDDTALVYKSHNCNVKHIYPCHCVSLLVRAKLMERLSVVETGVGMTVAIPD